MTKKVSKRVTRDQWLQQALQIFASSGEGGLKIEELARTLGVAKSGFYFHFKDREDFLQHLIDYWAHEYTEIVVENKKMLEVEPRQRLIETARLITTAEVQCDSSSGVSAGGYGSAKAAKAPSPPSTSRSVPVTKDASSLLSQSTAAATSRGCPIRPTG